MILAIIQARMGSSRLPGKVLLDLAGRPVLWRGLERVRQAGRIDQVLVATTDQPGDEPIRRFCAERGVRCFAGSEQDVLDRYYQAARFAGATDEDGIVRITADCPLIDPEVVDRVIEAYLSSGADYVSNVQPPTFPDGLDVEAFRFSALRRAWQEAKLVSEREHVTPYLRNQPEKFSAHNVTHSVDLSAHRWTLDEPADYALLQRIVTELDLRRPDFHLADVLQVLAEHPEWRELNRISSATKAMRNRCGRNRRRSAWVRFNLARLMASTTGADDRTRPRWRRYWTGRWPAALSGWTRLRPMARPRRYWEATSVPVPPKNGSRSCLSFGRIFSIILIGIKNPSGKRLRPRSANH